MRFLKTLFTLAVFPLVAMVGEQAQANPITMTYDGSGVTSGSNSTHLLGAGEYYDENGIRMTQTAGGHVHVHGDSIAVDHSQGLLFSLVSAATFNLTQIVLNGGSATIVGSNASSFTMTGGGTYNFGAAFQGITSFSYDSSSTSVINSVTLNASVPEPGTIALLGLGLAGIGAMRRRRGNTAA